MTQLDKLIGKIKARPAYADFGEVQTLLEAFGWRLDRQAGSHAVFTKPGEFVIGVPKHHGRRVKRVYLDRICERLGLDG